RMLALAFIIGVRWGASGVAVAYSSVFLIILLPYLYYCYAAVELTLWRALAALAPTFVASMVMVPVVRMVVWRCPHWPAALRVALAGVLGAAVYLTVLALVFRPFWNDLLGFVLHKFHWPRRRRGEEM